MSYNQLLHKLVYVKERFESKYIPEPNSGCWLWEGAVNLDGYGRFRFRGKLIGAPRFSLMLYKEQENKNLCVLHSCDNPCCVNPEHLCFGTHKQNMEDRSKKGRLKVPNCKGENHYASKLTDQEVREIKQSLNEGKSCSELGVKYNIMPGVISNIKRGKTWKHIC